MTVAHTTPYPWPFDGRLVPSRAALVVCGSGDVWSARSPLDAGAEANIARLRLASHRHGMLVVLVRHASLPGRPVEVAPSGAGPGRSGDHPTALAPQPGEMVVKAAGIDGFYGSDLDAVLRRAGRDQLLMTGRGLETTVHSTLRRANDRGYECLVVADACAPIEADLRPGALSSIEMSGGIFGAVGHTDDVLAALGP